MRLNIGPGRPFVDIVTELAPEKVHGIFPKVGPGYAEVTIRLRQQYRSQMVEFAQKDRYRKIPKPMGPEQIVYGDIVLQVAGELAKRQAKKQEVTQ